MYAGKPHELKAKVKKHKTYKVFTHLPSVRDVRHFDVNNRAEIERLIAQNEHFCITHAGHRRRGFHKGLQRGFWSRRFSTDRFLYTLFIKYYYYFLCSLRTNNHEI